MTDKNQAYKYKLYRRILAGLVLVVLGIIVVIQPVPNEAKILYRAVGTGLLTAGFGNIFRPLRLLNDPKKFKEDRVAEADERIRNIQNEASRLAGVVTVCACVIGVLMLAPANPETAWALFLMLAVFLVVFLTAYFWLSLR